MTKLTNPFKNRRGHAAVPPTRKESIEAELKTLATAAVKSLRRSLIPAKSKTFRSGSPFREAAFGAPHNLGILQGLAGCGLLKHADYLSTVSGGGYIGSWLHGVIKNGVERNGKKVEFQNSLPTEDQSPRDASQDPVSFLRKYPMADLVRNSSYLVLRWIYQDVARFQLFLHTEGQVLAQRLACPQDQAEELLAAKMLGRWRDGTPLELSPDGPSSVIPNDATFNYTQDLLGRNCPFSSHIRVVNPRSESLMAPAQTEGVPRVIRRGIPYGPEKQASSLADDGIARGLIGVFLCSNITSKLSR